MDTSLNDTLRIITGCLRPTPSEFLPVLAGIAPATLRREDHSQRLVNKALLDMQETPRPTQFTVRPNTSLPPGANLPRREWATLNRLRTGVGRFNSNMYRWRLRQSAACICGPIEQTAHPILHECPTLRPPEDTLLDLLNPNPDKVSWLQQLNQTG